MMQRFYVFFDLDGTLVDSLPGLSQALQRSVHDVLGSNATQELPPMETLIGPPIGQIVDKLYPALNPDQKNALIATFRKIYDQETYKDAKLYDGVIETLTALKKDYSCSLYIVTNKSWTATKPLLEYLELMPFFDTIWAPQHPTQTFSKKADVLKMSSKNLGSQNCLMIGDSPEDYYAACEASVSFLGAAYGYGRVHEISELSHEYILQKFAELLPKIQKKFLAL